MEKKANYFENLWETSPDWGEMSDLTVLVAVLGYRLALAWGQISLQNPLIQGLPGSFPAVRNAQNLVDPHGFVADSRDAKA